MRRARTARDPACGELHTNFKLSGDGEYLALVEPDGVDGRPRVCARSFPEQGDDVSYGLALDADDVLSCPAASRADVSGADRRVAGNDLDRRRLRRLAVGRLRRGAQVLITEAATGNPDYVEIQNVSGDTVDTSGWVVAANDGA